MARRKWYREPKNRSILCESFGIGQLRRGIKENQSDQSLGGSEQERWEIVPVGNKLRWAMTSPVSILSEG